jgi:hypothetical protein
VCAAKERARKVFVTRDDDDDDDELQNGDDDGSVALEFNTHRKVAKL